MADSKFKDDASTMSFRPGRPSGAGGGSRLVVPESEGKDSPKAVDGPSLQPQWLKSPGAKELGRGPVGPPGYQGNDKPRWGKDQPPPRSKDVDWRKPGIGADWEPEGEPNRAPDNRWRDEEREGGGQVRGAANGFRDRWQVNKGGEANKWGVEGGGEHGADHRRDRWGGGDAAGENRKWAGGNRWDTERDKEAPPPRNKWGPEPDRDGGPLPGPRAPPEDGVFRRGNEPWRPTGRGRGGADPAPTGFAMPPGGFARGRGRGRAPGFGGVPEPRPPIGAPAGEFWDHQTPAPARGGTLERERAHRYSKEKMLELYKRVRGGSGFKKPETTAEVDEIVVKEGGEPFAFIELDEEDKSYYESIRKGEPLRPMPRIKEALEVTTPPQKELPQPGTGHGRGQLKPGAPGVGEEKPGGEDSFFDAPALSAQRGAMNAKIESAAEARFADAEKAGRGRDDAQLWRRNEGPPLRNEDEPHPKEEPARLAKPADDSATKDWRSNRFEEADRVWRKQGDEKTPEKQNKAMPVGTPSRVEEPPHRADQVSSWRKDDSDKTPTKPEKGEESPAHLLPDDLLSGGGKEDPAAGLWEGGEHENDEAYTEGGRQQPVLFWYKDPQGETQGPFPQDDIEQWLEQGFFTAELPVRRDGLPESAPFVPLGTALPHLKPKTPRMPPGYEHRELEGGRPDSREAKSERGSRPGTGPDAARGEVAAESRQQAFANEATPSPSSSWPQNHIAKPQQSAKAPAPEQPPLSVHYPSLQPEPSKPQPPQFQHPTTEALFPPRFSDLSFLHSEEPPKPQPPPEQSPSHPLFRGGASRPAEQPPPREQPPYFPHPAFAAPPPPQWPPQEQFLQPPGAQDLPPWLVGVHDSPQKGGEQQRPDASLPFPARIMSPAEFARRGGGSEQYIAYLHEQQQLEARFFQRMHLQRQHSGLSQHGEGGAFPGGMPPQMQPQPQNALSLEHVEAEQHQRLREEAEHLARLTQGFPPEQPPFLRGAFPPDNLPPHLQYPGTEQHSWPPQPPPNFHTEMLLRQQQHEQQMRGGAGHQPELPPFLQGVLPRERPEAPPQEQSIPPELLAAVQDGRLPVEALAQYLKSLGLAGEGGQNQGQEKPPAADGAMLKQGWTREQTSKSDQHLGIGQGGPNQAQLPPWANGEQRQTSDEGEARARAQQKLEEQQRAHFEKMHRQHLEEMQRQQQQGGLPRPWGTPPSTAQEQPVEETKPPAPWVHEPAGGEVSLHVWMEQPQPPKTTAAETRVPAPLPKEAPWLGSGQKERKSLLQIQMEEAERRKAEQARLEVEEAARIAAGGYGANQSGASPWGGAGITRPKTLKEIQEEEARQAAERNVKASQGGPVWGPSQAQGTPPVGNRMEKQSQLQARDTLAEQVILTAAVSAPQTPPPAKEEKKKKANEVTPPVKTISPEEEAEFVEAGSGKKGKKKGGKGKQAAAATKPAPPPAPMQSASPWAVEAAATRPSLRQLAAEESANTDDTPHEYSSKSAAGPSLADFIPGLHPEEKPAQQAPAWNTGGGGTKRMTLKEIQEAEKKETERRAAQEAARKAAIPRPVQTPAPTGAPWQRPTPSSAFPPPAAARNPVPPPKPAPAPAPPADDDDDLFWDYGKDVTIHLGTVQSKEPEQPAFPTLGGPPKPQTGGSWATAKGGANTGYKQVAAPPPSGARGPAGAGDFPTLAPTGAAATATGAKAKKRGAGTPDQAAPPSINPATAKAGQEFRRWCEQWTKKITGSDDLTLLDFCMTLPSAPEAGTYISEYWGSGPEVATFKAEFLKRRSAMPSEVLQADFFAAGTDRQADISSNTSGRASESTGDAQKVSTATEAAGKKKGKKAKKVVDNSLLGFSVHSNRINMGTIESAADAQ